MSQPVLLTGITWDHSRAFPPLVATAQRYEETHPGIRIRWEKRSLDEFGHLPIDQLAGKFDFIVIDHPWAGFAFEKDLVRDLKSLLPPRPLDEYARDFIGASFDSYCYGGRLLALPIDVAAPAPSWRSDLLERAGTPAPTTWTEAVALARRKLAVIPAFNADLFLHFLMLVKGLGSNPCADAEHIAPREIMRGALNLLSELTEPMPRAIFGWNPIQVAERMTATDDFAWNAFAYTYNNYARNGFAHARLQFGNLISLESAERPTPDRAGCVDKVDKNARSGVGRSAPESNGRRLRGVLGGTGIALSSKCANVEIAFDYASFVADAKTQMGLYLNAGGQPSRREAWDDPSVDRLCGGFFSGTRTSQEEAFIRPRYSGYVPLQTHGGSALQETLRDGRDAEAVLEKLDVLYRGSRQAASPPFQTN